MTYLLFAAASRPHSTNLAPRTVDVRGEYISRASAPTSEGLYWCELAFAGTGLVGAVQGEQAAGVQTHVQVHAAASRPRHRRVSSVTLLRRPPLRPPPLQRGACSCSPMSCVRNHLMWRLSDRSPSESCKLSLYLQQWKLWDCRL